MRRWLAIYGLVCALAPGAWGHVAPVAPCAPPPHVIAVVTPEHSCCHAAVQHAAHNDVSQQTAHAATPAAACCGARTAAVAFGTQASARFAVSCAHCAGRSAPVPLFVAARGAQPLKRTDLAPAAPVRPQATLAPLLPAARTPPAHAPPSGARKHVLLSTFLI